MKISTLFLIIYFVILFLIFNINAIKFERVNIGSQSRVNKFSSYLQEYSNITSTYILNVTLIEKVKLTNKIYAYFDHQNGEIKFTKEKILNKTSLYNTIISKGIFERTRNLTGWDKLYIKSFSNINPIIQMYISGIVEGALTSQEIFYHYENSQINFIKDKHNYDDLRNMYIKIDENLKKKFTIEYLMTLNEKEFLKWIYIILIMAQFQGLQKGYSIVFGENNTQLDIFDFYILNSKGNLNDLLDYIKVNNFDINDDTFFASSSNFKKIFNSDKLNEIWMHLRRRSSGIGLIVKTKDNLFIGQNSNGSYSNLLRTLKHYSFEFEGKYPLVGLKSKNINFPSYPGVLYSGDDFYQIDDNVTVLRASLNIINKFSFKNRINLAKYVPDFVRIMTCNLMSDNIEHWAKIYSTFISHFYYSQWGLIDYKNLNSSSNPSLSNHKSKEFKSNSKGYFLYLEETPGSISYKDYSDELNKNKYFTLLNIPQFNENENLLGFTYLQKQFFHYDSNENNPGKKIIDYYMKEDNKTMIFSLKEFENILTHNNFNSTGSFADDPSVKNPMNSLYPRTDLIELNNNDPTKTKEILNEGGIDFKIVNKEMMENSTFLAYSGPLYSQNNQTKVLHQYNTKNLKKYQLKFMKGIPKLWNFKPIYFKNMFNLSENI